jgi:hypothetical protein
VINDLNKVLEAIKGELATPAKKEAGGGKPTDLPKDTVVNAMIHTAKPYGCWTTTVATTVPPSEQ